MDSYKTPLGEIKITVIGHASLLVEWNGKYIYSDPYSEAGDFSGREKADLIIITHNHYDHYDESAWSKIVTDKTLFVVSQDVGKVSDRYVVLKNGESYNYEGLMIHAVHAYNVNRRNDAGELFHPRGVGNGYVLDFGGFRLYIAGDTEPIPEMRHVTNIDIAFLPKNLPYTMTDEEFVQVANTIRPKYLYPIHYFELDVAKLIGMLDTGITMIVNNK